VAKEIKISEKAVNMKTTKLIVIFAILSVAAWGCSKSSSIVGPKEKPIKWPTASHFKIDRSATVQDTLFTIISNPSLTKQQKQQLSAIENSYNDSTFFKLINTRIARLNPNAASLLLNKSITLGFQVSDSVVFVAKAERVRKKQTSNNTYIFWDGLLQNIKGGVELTYSNKLVLSGSIYLNYLKDKKFDRIIKFESLGDGLEALIQYWINNSIPLYN
jgi:hypothetical protein